MRIIIEKSLIPQLNARINSIKSMEQYQFSGYNQSQAVLEAPSGDLPLGLAMDLGRLGATIEAYEYWVEIPNANLGDNIPPEVSYGTYLDESEILQNRTWTQISELAANFAATATMRFWQPANNGNFLWNDVELIEEAGFEVFGHATLSIKTNKDYEDTGDIEYAELETIEYIDQNWRFAGYFDMLHAYLAMRDIYDAKGGDDNARWAASTDAEKAVLVRWNQVGLTKAASIIDPGYSEARTVKEVGHLYREFNLNMVMALEKRFTDWYQYLNMVLTNAGATKFDGDWSWDLKEDYTHRMLRQYELAVTNALVDFNQTILSTYVDADFFGTIPAATIVANLEDVLNAKTYPI